jgi:LacI family transcriptional regulator
VAVTLSEVASRAGVSLATASRALNGSRRQVGAELAERVRAAARELGYLPNAPAQALARATTATVGIVLHDVSDPYFATITKGVGTVAAEAGLLPLIVSTEGDPEREAASIRTLRAQRVRAVILAGSGYVDEGATERIDAELAAYLAEGGAVAAITDHGAGYDTVLPANRAGASSLTAALVASGRRDVAVIAGPTRMRVTAERLDGVREALRAAGLELPPSAVESAEFSRDAGQAAAARLLDRLATPPGALIVLSDVMATGVLAELRERGVSVPADVAVTGFDDIPLAADLTPALTTVRIPMARMGARAMSLALSPGSPLTERRVVELAAEVVPRASAPLASDHKR